VLIYVSATETEQFLIKHILAAAPRDCSDSQLLVQLNEDHQLDFWAEDHLGSSGSADENCREFTSLMKLRADETMETYNELREEKRRNRSSNLYWYRLKRIFSPLRKRNQIIMAVIFFFMAFMGFR